MTKIRKSFVFGCAVGAAIVLAAVLIMSHLSPPTALTPESVARITLPPPFPPNTSVDHDWLIKVLSGSDVHLQDLKGRVVFLTFWATWCLPCLAELPSVQRLYEKLDGKRVSFLCVSPEDNLTVKNFAHGMQYTVPMFTFESNPPSEFVFDGYPCTFIIAPDGRIVFRHSGTATWDDDSSVDFITKLLR